MVLRIIFIHLDLGIGGAEQLILQLAQASLAINNNNADSTDSSNSNTDNKIDLSIVTTRCDAHHCFAAVKPGGTGNLHPHLHVYGRWIPASLFGDQGRVVMSTIRVLYLAYCVARQYQHNDSDNDDIDETLIVLDVLPTPLPFLRWTTRAALLFYCHFPDQLLTRNNNTASTTGNSSSSRRWYRSVFDQLENITMQYADTIVVNSQFTKRTVQQTFPFLQQQNQQNQSDNDNESDDLPVLYPALDTSSLDNKNYTTTTTTTTSTDDPNNNLAALLQRRPIVSLNRYERKKNLELLLQAIQWIQEQHQNKSLLEQLPPIIIAGGYDVHNVENVVYRAELQMYCIEHNLTQHVTFLQSISDETRCQLLHHALVVIYTPTNEHFGIVPLEAMYSATPVICVDSGGPVETVVHETTGFLCQPTATAFGQTIWTLLQDPKRATSMGQAARAHVVNKFGQERLHQEWKRLVYDTIQKSRTSSSSNNSTSSSSSRRRRMTPRQYQIVRCILYIMEAVVTLGACLCLVYSLRRLLNLLTIFSEPSATTMQEL